MGFGSAVLGVAGTYFLMSHTGHRPAVQSPVQPPVTAEGRLEPNPPFREAQISLDPFSGLPRQQPDLLKVLTGNPSRMPNPLGRSIDSSVPELRLDSGARVQGNLAGTIILPDPTPTAWFQLKLEAGTLTAAAPALAQTKQVSLPTERELPLQLGDAVVLVLQNNKTLKNAYLQRLLDRRDLEVAEGIFNPIFEPRIEARYDRLEIGGVVTEAGQGDARIGATMLLPTGAQFSITIGATRSLRDESLNPTLDTLRQDLQVSLVQPLLRGFGADVTLAPINLARIQEQANRLLLKATLISTITTAIQTYRTLLEAQEQWIIQQQALKRAGDNLAYVQALVEAGRRARVDTLQGEADLARQQLQLKDAEGRLAAARLNLLQILGIDQKLTPVAIEPAALRQPIMAEADRLLPVALANNPDYLQSLLQIEAAKINLLLAQNNSEWNLNLVGTLGNNFNNVTANNNTTTVALVLTRQFGNLALDQAVERSRIQLQQSENRRAETLENLTVTVRNRSRDVNLSLQQVENARRVRELAEQTVTVQRERLQLGGRGVSVKDVLDFEDRLVQAKNDELAAIIRYLNAVTLLEQTIGTTLNTWNIRVESQN
ncbi:hypothetical protein BST81_24730 [Leptolyngbya sp. 'hensonii']|nr:hypothetical protein BST81_24730 [Leptolyngbya sp. 'hensonii']